jgi:hypothetical protein
MAFSEPISTAEAERLSGAVLFDFLLALDWAIVAVARQQANNIIRKYFIFYFN